MLRPGPLALVAMLTWPISAAADPRDADEIVPVIVAAPSRAPSPGAKSESTVKPLSQVSIAQEAQKELRRVGCYEGEANGIWTPSSRLPAQRFVDRINAKLPTDKPDEVLLALLRNQAEIVCGQCQSDQTPDAAGRCIPTALISNRALRPRPTATQSVSDAVGRERPPPDQMQAVPEQVNSGASRRSSQANPGTTKPWQALIKKVDRALGLY